MLFTVREPSQHDQHWLRVADALSALCGAVSVFLFGFLVGRLTEPVPGTPGNVPWLSWLVLPLIVFAVIPPLVTPRRRVRREPRSDGRSEGCALSTGVPTQEVDGADQASRRKAAAAFQAAVREARQEAETQLTAAIERVRQE